ncbi:MAG: WhiB family transcriptional regulator [Actinomycetota bacterium]
MKAMRTPPPPTDLLVLDLEERPWAAFASCRSADPELFFSPRDDATDEAIRICRGCPVVAECLEWALESRVRYGIWGATTERERRRMLRRSA